MATRSNDATRENLGRQRAAAPAIRKIEISDVREAFWQGVDDFRAIPTHGVFYGLVYVVLGLILVRIAFNASLLPMLFPLVAGFALLGPIAAIGLYELSRRREQGEETRWWHALRVGERASIGSILRLAAALAVWFVLWLFAASAIFDATIGTPPAGAFAFLGTLFTTPAGWSLIIVGHVVGALFAVVAFVMSVVSFPILVDRDVGFSGAVATSIQAARANPKPMLVWALMIAAGLILGSAPLLLGLPIVLPIFGHASWHIYRRVVV